jgi:hypothetical protein
MQKPGSNSSIHFDGDFDNGIITRIQSRRLITRLAGVKFKLFSNYDAMGEGWSDYFVIKIKPNDVGNNIVELLPYTNQQMVLGDLSLLYRFSSRVIWTNKCSNSTRNNKYKLPIYNG